MSGAFLDTTVLISLAEPNHPGAVSAQALVNKYQPSQAPYYAIHELLSGRLRLLCDCHNAMIGANNPAEAAIAFLKRSPAEGRKREARVKIILEVLAEMYTAIPGGSRDQMKQESMNALSLKIAQLWLAAKSHRKVDLVQPLACFVDGDLTTGSFGEIRAPGNFNCDASQKCAAARSLYQDKLSLQKMIDALHPKLLSAAAQQKNENIKRRKALKELLDDGPEKFHKGRCRAIGDAYFAAMAPPGSAVATSNPDDFEPLCNSLGKTIVHMKI